MNAELVNWIIVLYIPHISSTAAAVTVIMLILFLLYEFRRWVDR